MTLNANGAGVVTGKFTIPANIPVGSKPVALTGANGSRGVATFTGRGTITTEERRQVTTVTETWTAARVDPLAQTFTLDTSRHIGAVDLWFTAKGSADVVVQLRETANGFPGPAVLAETRVAASAIVTNGNHTRIAFAAPVWLVAGIEYALVVMTDDAVTALAVAELGKYDSNANKWITSQAYQVGVLLSSSNASTWTAHQEKDLAFRLLGARFAPGSKSVALGTVAVTDLSDMLALCTVEVPATGAKAEITATAPDGTVYKLPPGTPINLASRITGDVTLAAALTGTETASPVIYPGMQFAAGDLTESATYVSREFVCGSTARISVTFEAYAPGTSDIAVAIRKSDGSWQTLTLTSGTNVGDGWVERHYVTTGFSATTTAVRLTLTGTAAYRPKARKLRAVATD